jgi:hypothetical protein
MLEDSDVAPHIVADPLVVYLVAGIANTLRVVSYTRYDNFLAAMRVAEDLPARSAVVNPRHNSERSLATRMLALFGLVLFLDARRREFPRRRWKRAHLLNFASLDAKRGRY